MPDGTLKNDPLEAARGYIFSRPIAGDRIPQHIQNLVNRDFASRQGLQFKLSTTEYASDNCYLMLDAEISAMSERQGVILYSLFMLPPTEEHRRDIYRRVLERGSVLFAAVENYRIGTADDVDRVERVLQLCQILAQRDTDDIVGRLAPGIRAA
ncbi:MAG: sporadic carbohydrate cluster protein, LIC12192 family [Alphaproteobacteria bacterium]|uniref:LIC12192 family sporadic carbohydrate cluster protein n=1 Tax=Pacificispira sp. TaxID=2888761 RepID=UPI001B0B69C8|nr:sporadic carbohydrate cluster protein, LIC12192 family [Alphaproteobacteria bacterium]MBO6863511.1 sporadic carbohydrate cluster protein, LIC12192 family [Alphaproteobacteria bacterium]MEC9266175.1 LIC12192 family sporadic carbohydrate cluster protein [Pseudomonadota bacterium]